MGGIFGTISLGVFWADSPFVITTNYNNVTVNDICKACGKEYDDQLQAGLAG